MFFSEFCQKIIGYVISELQKMYSAGKTSGVLRGGALEANRGNELAQLEGGNKLD